MSKPLREAVHLIVRFFDVAGSSPLGPGEQAEVARLLRSDDERRMFWDQPLVDQRHGLAAARHVAVGPATRDELVRAALLHDTGKRHARLGIFGRVVASLVRATGDRGRGRVRHYLDHGAMAARELEDADAEPLVVMYARHHHGYRPASISAEDWEVLDAADRARK